MPNLSLLLDIVLYAACAGAVALFVLSCRLYVHMLQQEGYLNSGLVAWMNRNGKRRRFALSWSIALIAARVAYNAARMIFSDFVAAVLDSPFYYTFALIDILFALAALLALMGAIKRLKLDNAKKPLQYTGRVKRLFVTIAVLSALFAWLMFALNNLIALAALFGCLPFLLLFLQPECVLLANLVNAPIESSIKKWYLNDAKKKLASHPSLIKIGITGSYGKTSTKFFLGAILSERYSVLTPPSSYNTPMGLTKIIRGELNPGHEVFLAEMGARHVGDIAELCELVHPSIGIITSIGPQHLETFNSLARIKQTKFELIEALPKDGFAVFNADNMYCLDMYDDAGISKALYGIDYQGECFARARDIELGPFGSRFILELGSGSVKCETLLLGKHNILNILGAAAVAYHLGLTLEEIALGIGKLKSVEHRLELIPTTNGLTVIDDAFNSNPSGVAMAMDVISRFKGRKIVITPGMVELGEAEEEENRKFGALMARVADVVLLVGKNHTAPIYEELIKGGMPKRNVAVFNTLDEATEYFSRISMAGDVVIFENDLPDSYNEA